jgi:hypothetical protein
MAETVTATINYAARMAERPRYHANDSQRDLLDIDPQRMTITDTRGRTTALDVEGFTLVPHLSRVMDFTDPGQVMVIHAEEIVALITRQTAAEHVTVNSPGVLRFSEVSARSGALNNSRPARFAHVDVSDATAAAFASRAAPMGRTIRRTAHYNVWRVISEPPQDVPLTVCDARSVSPTDLITADAVFDEPGKPEWSFEGWVVAHNPAHCWHWFSDMTRDEVLIFKTNDTDRANAHCVPHVAFDNPLTSPDTRPRASIEMRAIAYWFD